MSTHTAHPAISIHRLAAEHHQIAADYHSLAASTMNWATTPKSLITPC